VTIEVFENLEELSWTADGSGGIPVIAGCQTATVDWPLDEIAHSECNEDAISYRGVTGLTAAGTMELAGVSLAREVGSFSFGGALAEVMGAELAEVGEDEVHNADGNCWATLIRIRKRSVEASVDYRALRSGAAHEAGTVDTLSVSYLLGSLTHGCPTPGSGVAISVPSMMVLGYNPVNAKHSQFADGKLSFKGTASSKLVGGGPMLSSLHVGDKGTVGWKVPSATGGASLVVAVINAIITEKRITFAHGGMLRESFSWKAYSSDGVTPPCTVT